MAQEDLSKQAIAIAQRE
jgi:hypothetical protein